MGNGGPPGSLFELALVLILALVSLLIVVLMYIIAGDVWMHRFGWLSIGCFAAGFVARSALAAAAKEFLGD